MMGIPIMEMGVHLLAKLKMVGHVLSQDALSLIQQYFVEMDISTRTKNVMMGIQIVVMAVANTVK